MEVVLKIRKISILTVASASMLAPLRGERYLGSSRTATLAFKKGVKNFEKGKLDKAARHFRAALRADGSKSLDKTIYHYLANISHKQGDETKVNEYAQAYHSLK